MTAIQTVRLSGILFVMLSGLADAQLVQVYTIRSPVDGLITSLNTAGVFPPCPRRVLKPEPSGCTGVIAQITSDLLIKQIDQAGNLLSALTEQGEMIQSALDSSTGRIKTILENKRAFEGIVAADEGNMHKEIPSYTTDRAQASATANGLGLVQREISDTLLTKQKEIIETQKMAAQAGIETLKMAQQLGEITCPQQCRVVKTHVFVQQWVNKGDPLVDVTLSVKNP